MEFAMRHQRTLLSAGLLSASLLLTACGGGGGGGSTDVVPSQPIPPAPTAEGPNAYLLFPNPQVQPDSTKQTDTAEYADAYYRAIDPNNERSTLDKYKMALVALEDRKLPWFLAMCVTWVTGA
jgi:hypothetical protein